MSFCSLDKSAPALSSGTDGLTDRGTMLAKALVEHIPRGDQRSRIMLIHWVVVADSARAEIYQSDLLFKEFEPVESRIHPKSRVKAKDIVAGDRGSNRAYAGAVHSAYERHTEPHRGAQEEFAREIAELLRVGRVEERFERLVLIATPGFLGKLRAELDEETAKRVIGSIAHGWVDMSPVTLAEQVRRHFAG